MAKTQNQLQEEGVIMAKRQFAVFDIDGTLFRWQLFHEIVAELILSGHIPKSAQQAIEEKIKQWRDRVHRHAFTDYEMAVVNAFRPHLANLKISDIEAASDRILARSGNQVYAYTRDLIDELRAKDYVLIALSGSQDEIVRRFAKLWDFDIALGQVHESRGGLYTGAIPGGKLLVEQKGDLLKNIVEEHDLSWEGSVAVGDSLSDAAMLRLVERPIAFNPNDLLFDIAKKHGWQVVIERKNMIYELESRDGTYVLAKTNGR